MNDSPLFTKTKVEKIQKHLADLVEEGLSNALLLDVDVRRSTPRTTIVRYQDLPQVAFEITVRRMG